MNNQINENENVINEIPIAGIEDNTKLINKKGILLKILKVKIPFWFILFTVIMLMVTFGVFKIKQDKEVTLNPLVKTAEKVQVTLLVCNEKIDELEIDPRKEEKRLELEYTNNAKVKLADVKISRKDCNK